jgi:tight adherence protein C
MVRRTVCRRHRRCHTVDGGCVHVAQCIDSWFWQRLRRCNLAALLLAKRGQRRAKRIDRELPFILDMTMLCVQAGLNLQGALQQAAQYGPTGPLRDELQIALSEMRTGASRMQALKSLAARTNVASLKTLVSSLTQADLLGMNLGPILSSRAAQCRTDRFQRAERLAMEAPVKMLFPLIACIFPCTFVVIGFPIAVSVMELKV